MEQAMKTVIAALALITVMSAPSFAQHSSPPQHNESPASPSFGNNGY